MISFAPAHRLPIILPDRMHAGITAITVAAREFVPQRADFSGASAELICSYGRASFSSAASEHEGNHGADNPNERQPAVHRWIDRRDIDREPRRPPDHTQQRKKSRLSPCDPIAE